MQSKTAQPPEPIWSAVLAIVAAAGLGLALPSNLTVGPDWLLLAVVCVLLVPTVALHNKGHHDYDQILGYIILVIVTADLAVSLGLMVAGLKVHPPFVLLRSAAGLWVGNVLVFASWYWRLDAGGPHSRAARESHTTGAFLFPQMALSPEMRKLLEQRHWRPGFIDYLFLAFSTSTAFSPTDVPVLSRWAKVLMMIQSSISLGTLALLAARAVNVL